MSVCKLKVLLCFEVQVHAYFLFIRFGVFSVDRIFFCVFGYNEFQVNSSTLRCLHATLQNISVSEDL